MTERAAIFEVVQLGVETTPGTGVSANKRLLGLTVTPRVQAETNPVRPSGYKTPTSVVVNKEWSEATIGGHPAYNDLTYMFASCISYAAPTEVEVGSVYQWTFAPGINSEDTVKTYTVECGSSARAGKFTYGLVRNFSLSFSRDRVEQRGTMMGWRYTDGITLTASPTEIGLIPILPAHVDVYMDDTAVGLGTTKLTRNMSADFEIPDRFGQVWALNSANESFAAHIEREINATLRLRMEADATGMALLTALRDGDKKFVRIQATGPSVGAASNYTLTIDMCGMVSAIGEFSDSDGVYAVEFTLQAVYDSDWGKAFEVRLINSLAAL